MIKSVTITNYLGSLDEHVQRSLGITSYDYNNSTIHVKLNEPDPVHGFIVKKIEGLGPAKADINMTDLATVDGSRFNSARLGTRNLVLTFGFDNCNDAEEARYRTYKYLPIKRKVMVSIETESRNARVVGYVESNEPGVFSKAVQCTISIICPDPYFYSNEYGYSPHVIEFSGLNNEFMFSFENWPYQTEPNTVLHEDWDEGDYSHLENVTVTGPRPRNIEMGAAASESGEVAAKDFSYEGDQEIGVYMEMHALDTITTDVIFVHKKNKENPNEGTLTSEFKLSMTNFNLLMDGLGLAHNFLTGDSIFIDTTDANKTIYLQRGASRYNILNAVTRDSDWFQLAKGRNWFWILAENASHLTFKVKNYVIYEGV